MARITEECVARIKDATDIVAVIGRYVSLRRAGFAWKACCPFHNEKTPSFHVNPARQSFHCFGCGEGGDAVSFIMKFENLDYPTALRRLADMNGVPIIEEEENPEAVLMRRLRGRIIETNELAAHYYHNQLCRSKAADHVRDYLRRRGINLEVAKAWQLGWAPPDFRELRRLAATRRINDKLLNEAYLLGESPRGAYPVFRDRLMFPIRNVRGEVVGFSGRIMQADQDPRKYVNTAETAAFRKGELLFGLYKATSAIAKAGMSVVICEGQLDVIACHENADIRNAVAGLGTAFTDEHARILAKYAKKAILCYDGDQAGINASEKTYRKLVQAGLEVYQAELPPGEDPDSLIRTRGAEALQQAVAEARPYLEARIAREQERIQDDLNARAALIPRLADLVADIADPVRRDVSSADVATRLRVGLDSFRTTIDTIIRERKKSPANRTPRESHRQPDPEEDTPANDIDFAHVVPIKLHPSIQELCISARSSKLAQHLLSERIEELQEPIRWLDGGVVLQRLLEARPTPGDEEAWTRFLHSLPPEQAAALQNLAAISLSDDAYEEHIHQICNNAAFNTVRTRLDFLKTRANDTRLSPDIVRNTMQEIGQLNAMLSQIKQ